MKYIVIETYTDSSYNDYHHTFIVDDRQTAVKLANTILDAFTKNELLDGWDKECLEKDGNFKTDNYKVIWNEKHQTKVEIQEANFVKEFEMVEDRDEYGKYYAVKYNG